MWLLADEENEVAAPAFALAGAVNVVAIRGPAEASYRATRDACGWARLAEVIEHIRVNLSERLGVPLVDQKLDRPGRSAGSVVPSSECADENRLLWLLWSGDMCVFHTAPPSEPRLPAHHPQWRAPCQRRSAQFPLYVPMIRRCAQYTIARGHRTCSSANGAGVILLSGD